MMPYISVIKDSFREAMSSRVLWLVLALITVVLLALLPFHWVGTLRATMNGNDIRNIQNVAAELRRGEASDATPLQKRIWDGIRKKTRERLKDAGSSEPRRRFKARASLAEDFNRLIEKDDFFDPQLWEGVELSSRLNKLLDDGTPNTDSTMYRNRLALEAALPGMLRTCPAESMAFRYGIWDVLDDLPAMSRAQASDQIDWLVMLALPMFVGFFGIFAAILVTAPIIPNMLASGSLQLLLSKPVARPLLFLSKFVGGCSFVLINVLYLVTGIVLLLGFRFQMWKPELLWTIPIFLFSFAIFYSVSAVAGLIWRSTVLAIAMTVIFWVLCVTLAATRGVLQQLMVVPQQISRLVPAGDELFVQRRSGEIGRWNAESNAIEEVMESHEKRPPMMMMTNQPKYIGIIYDKENEMLLAMSRTWSESKIYAALRDNGWQRELPTSGPKNSLALFSRNGLPTVVSEEAVQEISMAQAEEPLADINIFGWKIPALAAKDTHGTISSKFARLPSGTLVGFSAPDDKFYLQHGHTLKLLEQQNGVFAQTIETKLEPNEFTHVAAGKDVVVLASRGDASNSLHVIRSTDLSPVLTLEPEGDDAARNLDVSEDGRWLALLTDDDELTVFDLKDNGAVHSRRSDISAILMQGNSLLTSDTHDHVANWSLADGKQETRIKPKLSMTRRIYRYAVNPLYLICPKPSELDSTMRYALTGKDTIEAPELGPNGRTIQLDPWQPLYSNSAFIGVMLLLGSWYVYRQDF